MSFIFLEFLGLFWIMWNIVTLLAYCLQLSGNALVHFKTNRCDLSHKRFKSAPETLIETILICCCSVTQSCPTLCDPMDCSIPGFSVHHQLWELAQSHVHRVGDGIQPSRPLLPLLLLPSVFRVFSNELAIGIKGPQYWSFCFSLSPSNKYSGLISFRMDWLYLFAAQGTLRSLPQLFKNRIRSLCERSCHVGVRPSILVSSKCHMTCSAKILF